MDSLSHALWGYGLFGYRGYPWLSFLFGALPDLLSFGVLFIVRFITGGFTPGPPLLHTIPAWTFFTYNFTHSLFISTVVIAIIYLLHKGIGFAMLSWPFHIFLDIPFHTKEYFPTQMCWPITDFFVDGISWATPRVWYPNLAGILILFSYRWYKRKKGSKTRSIKNW
jgi:hypothetical protein